MYEPLPPGYGIDWVTMCRRVPITVEVDERGRLTIPEAAREALGVTAGDPIVFDVEVLSPDDAAGSTAVDVTQTLGDRGRITIKPSSVRDELGIRVWVASIVSYLVAIVLLWFVSRRAGVTTTADVDELLSNARERLIA